MRREKVKIFERKNRAEGRRENEIERVGRKNKEREKAKKNKNPSKVIRSTPYFLSS